MSEHNPSTEKAHGEQDRPMVVDVVFQPAGQFHPHLCGIEGVDRGTQVVVDTERGLTLAMVGDGPRPASPDEARRLASVLRIASVSDIHQDDRNRDREMAAFRICLQLIIHHRLVMKLVKVHYLLGANKAVFYFTADGRIDFRALVKDLAAELRLRIEMRQIGVRDETKILGGVGHCGRELCCSTWLRTFVPVSIRMAKDQNLALNPQKVSGACGRLMCCLAYEHETYVEMKRGLPKIGKRVRTRMGSGRVINVEILKQRFVVDLEDGGRVLLSPEDLEGGQDERGGRRRQTQPPGADQSGPRAPENGEGTTREKRGEGDSVQRPSKRSVKAEDVSEERPSVRSPGGDTGDGFDV